MRNIVVSETLSNKIESSQSMLSASRDEFSDRITPGEWVQLKTKNFSYLAYGYPQGDKNIALRVCTKLDGEKNLELNKIIGDKLQNACERREITIGSDSFCRIVYGQSDELPGLIIDRYKDLNLIEINTFGMWNIIENVKNFLKIRFPSSSSYVFVRDKYDEGLPVYENHFTPEEIVVEESGFRYIIPWNRIQKIGFYYDHRMNRLKLEQVLTRVNKEKIKLNNGLDLFCYHGSWGLSMLRAGVEKVELVDQADFDLMINAHMRGNGFEGKGTFTRGDVFQFLENKIKMQKKFDVIVSDPPAFTKKREQKNQAIKGYDKLHEKCLTICSPKAIFVAASCTSYLTHNELDESVKKAAKRSGREVRLIDIGLQSPDHPFSSLNSSENYIKYLCYFVE